MNQKGFINIILIIIVIALVGAGAYFVSTRQVTSPTPNPIPSPSPTPSPTPTPTPQPSPTSKPSSTPCPSQATTSPVSGQSAPIIFSLSPCSGYANPGVEVTITGTGFIPSGNTANTIYFSGKPGYAISDYAYVVHLPGGSIALSFVVPSLIIYPTNCRPPDNRCSLRPQIYTPPGSYLVTVTNANGTSNPLMFTVLAPPPIPQSAPVISLLSPSSGPVGTQVTITGSGGFTNQVKNHLNFGNLGMGIYAEFLDVNHLTFIIPAEIGTGMACPTCQRSVPVTPGAYKITVDYPGGTSNSLTFTVTPH